MGRGDFLAVAEGRVIRLQVAHVSPSEIRDMIAKMSIPATPIDWPMVETENEPDGDEALARLLVESELWVDRYNDDGYRWGFLSDVCKLPFDQPLAGAFHARTNAILTLAESISTASIADPTSTTQEMVENAVEIEDGPVSSGSSRVSDAPEQVDVFCSEAPAVLKVKTVASVTAKPLDITPDQALLIGIALGFGAGFCVKILIDLIRGLL
jgi:hypothetical protein